MDLATDVSHLVFGSAEPGMDDTLFDSLPFEGMWYVMFPKS